MTDQVGTVRRSPDGLNVIRTTDEPIPWFAANPADIRRWFTDDDVLDWEVVYKPERPVGTVMRREVTQPGKGWEVAVRTEKGWVWASRDGLTGEGVEAPYDDEQGAWEVLHP